MNSQSNWGNQWPKNFKVSQSLKLVALLVICIWLLYQIKNSSNENKDLNVKVNTKNNEEQTSIDLGRRGNHKEPKKDESRELDKGGDEENDNGTMSTISFNDENGIPQHIREGQIGNFFDKNGDNDVLEDPKNEFTNDGEEEIEKDFENFRSVSIHQIIEENVERSTHKPDE